MDATVNNLEAELRRLSDRVGIQLDVPRHIVAVSGLVNGTPPVWQWAKGIYAFEIDGAVMYVGRALGSGMWERTREHITKGDSDWRAVVEDPRCRIRLYIFDVEDVFWSASFEARLIELLRPRFNKRIS